MNGTGLNDSEDGFEIPDTFDADGNMISATVMSEYLNECYGAGDGLVRLIPIFCKR